MVAPATEKIQIPHAVNCLENARDIRCWVRKSFFRSENVVANNGSSIEYEARSRRGRDDLTEEDVGIKPGSGGVKTEEKNSKVEQGQWKEGQSKIPQPVGLMALHTRQVD